LIPSEKFPSDFYGNEILNFGFLFGTIYSLGLSKASISLSSESLKLSGFSAKEH
jgi:hypothetical protein